MNEIGSDDTLLIGTITRAIVAFPGAGFVKDRCRTGHISDSCKAHVQLQEICKFPEHFLVQYRAQFPILCPGTV